MCHGGIDKRVPQVVLWRTRRLVGPDLLCVRGLCGGFGASVSEPEGMYLHVFVRTRVHSGLVCGWLGGTDGLQPTRVLSQTLLRLCLGPQAVLA